MSSSIRLLQYLSAFVLMTPRPSGADIESEQWTFHIYIQTHAHMIKGRCCVLRYVQGRSLDHEMENLYASSPISLMSFTSSYKLNYSWMHNFLRILQKELEIHVSVLAPIMVLYSDRVENSVSKLLVVMHNHLLWFHVLIRLKFQFHNCLQFCIVDYKLVIVDHKQI